MGKVKRKAKGAASADSGLQDAKENPATAVTESPLWLPLSASGLLAGVVPKGLPGQGLRQFCSDFIGQPWGRGMTRDDRIGLAEALYRSGTPWQTRLLEVETHFSDFARRISLYLTEWVTTCYDRVLELLSRADKTSAGCESLQARIENLEQDLLLLRVTVKRLSMKDNAPPAPPSEPAVFTPICHRFLPLPCQTAQSRRQEEWPGHRARLRKR